MKMPAMKRHVRKPIQDMIGELRSWLPNYDHGPADYPTLLWRILASAPGGDQAADMGYEPFQLGWQEISQLGEVLAAIQDKRDVEDLIAGLIGDEDEGLEEARRPSRPDGRNEIEAEARQMLQQIDEDIASRPQRFAGWDGTFKGLHDFVDANEYLPPIRSGPYKGEVIIDESVDPEASERSLARANAIIAEADRLLAQRPGRRRGPRPGPARRRR